LSVLKKFNGEIGERFYQLKDKVESNGPGKAAIRQAREQAITQEDTTQDKVVFDQELMLASQSGPILTKDDGDAMPIGLVEGWGWLMFSALSNWFGNTGQSNYACANMVMDALNASARQTMKSNFMPLIIMWGAVTGLGMRWKAFASQDFLLKADNVAEVIMDAKDAQRVLRFMVNGVSPEILAASMFDEQTKAFFLSGYRNPTPWGNKKGQGGGLTFQDDDSSDGDESIDEGILEEVLEENSKRLRVGQRVEICGLINATEMNGVRGTLIEEVSADKWQVKLEGSSEDKLIKVKNLKALASTPLSVKKSDFRPTAEYCLAGSWNDWTPQDMRWDEKEGCLMHDVEVGDKICPARFGVAMGRAGTNKWQTQKQKWRLMRGGKYRIKLLLKEGGVLKDVITERLGEVSRVSA